MTEPTFFENIIIIAIFSMILYFAHIFKNKEDGCFHASNRVTLGNGNYKSCDKIQRGDIVMMSNTKKGRIVCVVKLLKTQTNSIKLLQFPCGLIVTGYHPICIKGHWDFPTNIQIYKEYNEPFDAVYSFLIEMEDGSNVDCGFFVENIECAPLGHDMKGEIIGHQFFGNKELVKECLRTINDKQFEDGCVYVTGLERQWGSVVGFICDL